MNGQQNFFAPTLPQSQDVLDFLVVVASEDTKLVPGGETDPISRSNSLRGGSVGEAPTATWLIAG